MRTLPTLRLIKCSTLIFLFACVFLVVENSFSQSIILRSSQNTTQNNLTELRETYQGNTQILATGDISSTESNADSNDCDVSTQKIRLALLEQQYRVTKFYLERGLDPNVTDSFGMSLMMLSALSDNAKLLELYLDFGADVNRVDRSGRTALFWAVLSGNVEAVEALVRHGADIYQRDNTGKTIDHWLVMINDVDLVVKTFLESGLLITKNDYKKLLWFLYKSKPKGDTSGYILGQSTETIENGQAYTRIYFINSNLGDVRNEDFLRIAYEGFNEIPTRIGENSNYDKLVKILYTRY